MGAPSRRYWSGSKGWTLCPECPQFSSRNQAGKWPPLRIPRPLLHEAKPKAGVSYGYYGALGNRNGTNELDSKAVCVTPFEWLNLVEVFDRLPD